MDFDDYPDKDIPVYDDAVVYEFEGDKGESTIKYGTEDDVDDVTEFYQDYLSDESDDIVVIKEKVEDDEYKLEALYENYLFEVEVEEANRDLADHYSTVVEVIVEELDDDDADELRAKYASQPVMEVPAEAPAENTEQPVEATPVPEATPEPVQQLSAEDLYLMGEDYYYGTNGKEMDDAMALDYFVQSAELGYAPAYNMIGIMYEYGYGVTQSYDEALAYYQAASDMGYSMASCNVGLYYENGVSVLTSYNKAKQYYELAIQQTQITAMRIICLEVYMLMVMVLLQTIK